MRHAFTIALALFAAPAMAQTWAERQQIYNEKANLETELFQQREEMERMQQENKRAVDEQRRAMEQRRYELKQLNKEYSTKPYTPLSSLPPMDRQQMQDAIRAAENRAFVVRESVNNPIEFNEEAQRAFEDKLSALGMSAGDIENVRYSGKAMWLRRLKAAQQGNATEQRKLGIGYLEGRDLKRNPAEAIKWLRKAATQGDEEALTYLDRMKELNPH